MSTRAGLTTRRRILWALAAIAAGAGDGADASQDEILPALERYVGAWRAGDLAALVACYHADFTLHYFGRSPLAGDHRGRPAALRALAEVTRRTSRRLVTIIDVMAGRQRGAVIAREAFQRDGTTVELDRVLVYTVREGKLHECWVYDSDQPLVDGLLADPLR